MFTARLKRLDTSFDVNVDKTLWMQDLSAYLNQTNRVAALDNTLNEGDSNLDAKIGAMYTLTTLTDKQQRLAWMNADPAAFEASADPLYDLQSRCMTTICKLSDRPKP